MRSGWWYLSFAREESFLGAAVIEAGGRMHAKWKARKLGIYPGGHVLALPIMEGDPLPDAEFRNRLLSLPECKAVFGEQEMVLVEVEEET